MTAAPQQQATAEQFQKAMVQIAAVMETMAEQRKRSMTYASMFPILKSSRRSSKDT
jgi:hypothetical protein